MVQDPGQEGPNPIETEEVSKASSDADAVVIESPAAGQTVTIRVDEADQLQLRFDPDGVQVAQADGDLFLRFPNGGEVTLPGFTNEGEASPDVVLPDGTTVSGDSLAKMLAQLDTLPPLETAANPQGGPPSGGGSIYQSDLASLVAGLQAAGRDEDLGPDTFDPESNVSTFGAESQAPGSESGSGSDEEILTLVQPRDESLALEDILVPSENPIFVPPENPVGPGADTALFSKKADKVDLNAIDVGGYLAGSQYDAGKGNDAVVLAENTRQALEAGFETGTLFDAGRGNDLVTGGSLDDLVDGNQGKDTIFGEAGDDSLFGGSSNDSLDGGSGDDLIDGGRHHDLLLGGSGDDSLSGGHGRDTLEGESGRDLLTGGGGNDSLLGGTEDDQLFGEGGRDTLDGGPGADVLDGGRHHDLLRGGSGDDTLNGGSNNDRLFGERGDDILDGGTGRDTLEGGLGDDVMTGGDGRDYFSFSLAENQGDDVILDFRTGGSGDRLRLTDLLDENDDNKINIADLDAGGHTVSGTADAIVITFEQGGSVTLNGLDGSGVDSFADLLNAKVIVGL